jgi:hypothetical protein
MLGERLNNFVFGPIWDNRNAVLIFKSRSQSIGHSFTHHDICFRF